MFVVKDDQMNLSDSSGGWEMEAEGEKSK